MRIFLFSMYLCVLIYSIIVGFLFEHFIPLSHGNCNFKISYNFILYANYDHVRLCELMVPCLHIATQLNILHSQGVRIVTSIS